MLSVALFDEWEGELGQIRQNVDNLIRDREASIAESEAFIQRFREGAA